MLLTTADATALRAIPEGRGRRSLAGWLIFAGGLAVVAAAAATAPDAICSVDSPCLPLPLTSLMVGLVVAVSLMGFVHLGMAAPFAAVAAVVLTWHDTITPSQATAPWVHAMALANAGMCVALAWWVSRRPPVLGQWAEQQEQSPAPEPPRLSRPGRVVVAAGLVLLCLGLACIVWSVFRQQRADRQQAAAEVVTVRVTEVVDEFTIRVELPNEQKINLGVLSSVPYSVGSTHQLAADSHGLRQLLAEPYDATPWLTLAVLLIIPGLGLLLRGRAKRLAHQELFRQGQPVTAVFARWRDSAVHLFAGDATNHDLPLFRLAIGDRSLVPQAFPASAAVHDTSPVMVPAAVRATLYGIPAMGQWCAVRVNGLSFDPEKPIGRSADMMPLRPGELAQEGPLATAEVAAFPMHDYEPPPERLYVSRVRPMVAYTYTLAMPLVGAELFRRLPEWVTPLMVYAIVGAVSAGMMLFGWLTLIRPRVAWNGGGVTIRGAKGRRRRTLRWSEVTDIVINGDVVVITAGDEAIGVSSPKYGRISATGLWLRLRDARLHADGSTPPPAGFATGAYEGALVAALALAVTVGLSELALWAHVWASSL